MPVERTSVRLDAAGDNGPPPGLPRVLGRPADTRLAW